MHSFERGQVSDVWSLSVCFIKISPEWEKKLVAVVGGWLGPFGASLIGVTWKDDPYSPSHKAWNMVSILLSCYLLPKREVSPNHTTLMDWLIRTLAEMLPNSCKAWNSFLGSTGNNTPTPTAANRKILQDTMLRYVMLTWAALCYFTLVCAASWYFKPLTVNCAHLR